MGEDIEAIAADRPAAAGHVIFISGVPSSGKSTLAREMVAQDPALHLVSGDETIRLLHAKQRDTAHGLFVRMLDVVEESSHRANVVVDMTLPQTYVSEARERFGKRAVFVGLRISEEERVRRERSRVDRAAVPWSSMLSTLRGPDSLYDLSIDASAAAEESAREIAKFMTRQWPEL